MNSSEPVVQSILSRNERIIDMESYAPTRPLNPLLGIHAAVTRKGKGKLHYSLLQFIYKN